MGKGGLRGREVTLSHVPGVEADVDVLVRGRGVREDRGRRQGYAVSSFLHAKSCSHHQAFACLCMRGRGQKLVAIQIKIRSRHAHARSALHTARRRPVYALCDPHSQPLSWCCWARVR